ncbi:hypothetical protein E3N88_23140 [Mikania micrantha]|uniref:Uncharacterized protein n=1 Tax=Mikania micrantha TaxID=192012 RepID=A0A5N6NDK5_9ASTR|nr:hypothetical protein E3N88_23140 [Mikania micrantha]
MMCSDNENTKRLEILARKPLSFALSHNGYFVNGFKFHTQEHAKGHETKAHGVLHIDERFESPDEVNGSERLCLVTNTDTMEQTNDYEDANFEEEEFDDKEDASEDDDDNEMGSEHLNHGFDSLIDHDASDDYDYSDHEDDKDTTTRPSQRDSNVEHPHHDRFHKPFIRRVGKKFANSKVHRTIRKIFDASFEGPWSTFRQIPKQALDKMFETFRTSYSWEPSEEFANRQGFENVLRDRYGDIMLEMRKESTNNVRANGHFIINGQDNFNIMCDFPPRLVSQDVWRQLCLSERGRDNRMKVDSSGSISRHTGGSFGYDEHRIRLEIKLGKKPTFKQLFLHTHLKKESKAKYWVVYYDDNPKGMEFCTNRSKEAYGEKKQSFGIGSSDHHFILTGIPSSSIGSTPSNVMFEQSQQEVRELRSQIHELQSQVDTQKKQMIEEIKKEMNQMREEIMEE